MTLFFGPRYCEQTSKWNNNDVNQNSLFKTMIGCKGLPVFFISNRNKWRESKIVSWVSSQFFSELLILHVHSFLHFFPYLCLILLKYTCTILLVHFYIFTFSLPIYYFYFCKSKQPRRKAEISYLIFSFLKEPRLLAPKGAVPLGMKISDMIIAKRQGEYAMCD